MYRARHANRTARMRFGKLAVMVGLAGALVLFLAVPAALAGVNSNSQSGSKGYVSTTFCEKPLEVNQIASGDIIYVNLKIPTDYTGQLTFTLYQNGTAKDSENIIGTWTLTPIDCETDANLWYVTLPLLEPLAEGSYTLVIDYPGDGNFSADSFTIYIPEA
jgi:hypothetical protein